MGNYPHCYQEINLNKDPSLANDPRVYRVASTKNRFTKINTLLNKAKLATDDDELEELLALEEDLEKLKEEFRAQEEDKKREFEDPEDAKFKAEKESMDQSKYSVLSYKIGSLQYEDIEDGDAFMRQIIEGHKEIENGDSLMQDLGVS